MWNQTNPLFDQWVPCWWLSSSTQLRPGSNWLSLFTPQKLKQFSRGYLKVPKTLFDRHSPHLKVNQLNWGELPWYLFISLWKAIMFDYPSKDGHAETAQKRSEWQTLDFQWWRPLAVYDELIKNLLEFSGSVIMASPSSFIMDILTFIEWCAQCKFINTSVLYVR